MDLTDSVYWTAEFICKQGHIIRGRVDGILWLTVKRWKCERERSRHEKGHA